jgi:hypothetical protein
MTDKTEKPWRLSYGIHRRTLMSRDPNYVERGSLEECKKFIREIEEEMEKIGYCIWFAETVSPQGVAIKLHEGNDYE